MARQDKGSKDKGRPVKGYGQSPVEPGSLQEYLAHRPQQEPREPSYARESGVLLATAVERSRYLTAIAHAGALPGGGLTGTSQNAPRLRGVHVRIEGADGFTETEVTDADGRATWKGIALQTYTVSAHPPEGYAAPQAATADLARGQCEVHLFLPPLPGVLDVVAFHDVRRCGDPEGQDLIGNVGFDVYSDDTWVASEQTDHTGRARVEVPCPGLLRIVSQAPLHAGGTQMQPAFRGGLAVQLDPGQYREVCLPYVAGLGELRVAALQVSEGRDGKIQEAPLPGVRLLLYSETATGTPFRTATTPSSELTLSDLPAGRYTLVVDGVTGAGTALQLVDSSQATRHLDLSDGSVVHLPPLRFQAMVGRLEGSVRDIDTQRGLAGIRVSLISVADGQALEVYTDADGDYAFSGLKLGNYYLGLAEDKSRGNDGQTRVPAPGTPARQVVRVASNTSLRIGPLQLTVEEHVLTVQVYDDEGGPFAGTEVEIIKSPNEAVGTFITNDKGEVVVRLPEAGMYRAFLTERQVAGEAFVNAPAFLQLFARSGGPGGRRALPPGSLEVEVPYPLLTEGILPVSVSSASAPAAADLGQTVDKTLRDVLGWKSQGFKGNAKGFLEALNQSFALQEVEGHTEFTWTPRSYAMQPDLGAITGAQASLYTRAKVALDQSRPLLEGLYPLRTDADPQNTAAMRAIVLSGFSELVNELGTEGGPRVVRVDTQFQQLLGVSPPQAAPSDPEQVRGQLGTLANLFGLRRDQINTIEEEQDLTNFLILTDYVIGLYQSWLTQRGFFTRTGPEPFLGTQLVLVSRALAVVAESVFEVYLAMDSVFVGPAERQVVELRFADGTNLFVAELLSWIEQAASSEGPTLIQDGGKAGVVAFQPTLDRLETLAGEAGAPQNAADLPAGYRSARVQRALQELAEHLTETARLARQIRSNVA